jgi:hypothetical protein
MTTPEPEPSLPSFPDDAPQDVRPRRRRKRARKHRAEPSYPASPWEWKIPLALFVIGVIVLVAGAALLDSASPSATVLGIALLLVVNVPLTIAAMYLAANWLGLAFGYLHTAILKLAAISVFTTSLDQLGSWLGQPLLGWLAAIAISFYLFSYFFDLDFNETLLAVVAITAIQWVLLLIAGLFLGRLAA